ncbi:MAG TPA: helix-turn-helix transcriptional regulator [Urbifossiella sp.]|nr:helix-turn-helix transcriptional regulator [Urbifossiella sp.]
MFDFRRADELREALGMSVEELAARAGVSAGHMSNLLNGTRSASGVGFETVARVAVALKVSVGGLSALDEPGRLIWRWVDTFDHDRHEALLNDLVDGTSLLSASPDTDSYLLPNPLALDLLARGASDLPDGERTRYLDLCRGLFVLRRELRLADAHPHAHVVMGTDVAMWRASERQEWSEEILANLKAHRKISALAVSPGGEVWSAIREEVGRTFSPPVQKVNVIDTRRAAVWSGSWIFETDDKKTVEGIRMAADRAGFEVFGGVFPTRRNSAIPQRMKAWHDVIRPLLVRDYFPCRPRLRSSLAAQRAAALARAMLDPKRGNETLDEKPPG